MASINNAIYDMYRNGCVVDDYSMSIRMRREQEIEMMKFMQGMTGTVTASTGHQIVPVPPKKPSLFSLREKLDAEMTAWCGGILERA